MFWIKLIIETFRKAVDRKEFLILKHINVTCTRYRAHSKLNKS
jgi:hypothetical protein